MPPRVRTLDLENPFVESLEGMCEILLVRHGEQQFRDNIPLNEAVDAPLSDLGWMQARAVGERLSTTQIDAVYCSPLRRAHDTAIEIARHQQCEPALHVGLTEIDPWAKAPQDKGLRDAFSTDELRDIYRQVNSTRLHSAYPYSDDPAEFKARVVATIDEIVEANIGRRVAVACHGGVINAYLSHLLKSAYDHIVSVHHTSITVLRAADTRRELLTINDFAHVLPFQTARGGLNASR